MKIEETLLTKRILIETKDPYGLALDLMEFVSRFGKVVERENKYETDGPERKTTLNFDLLENVDRSSHWIVEFFTRGRTNNVNYLEIDVTAKFVAEIAIDGFFSSAFAEHYLKHVYPRHLKAADERAGAIDRTLTEFASSSRKQKAALR